MRDVQNELLDSYDAGAPFVIANGAGVRGSAPRRPGARDAVDAAGEDSQCVRRLCQVCCERRAI
jgi:xanthine/CO dehydrogenase XdhC/CoxF family maturation factor